MAKSDELVKYITQRVVHYVDTPPEIRRSRRQEWKQRPKETLDYRLFGLASLSVRMWLNKAKRFRPRSFKAISWARRKENGE
ncbi:YqzE family protein [Paenibacillus senegalensis]|uniref:YqzE family protein n=1 Tax=Paenibacillus senegalensis TaxID=1465766 RepID=UPI00028927FF|nr:YqzE family protein [Paenibacillus senegalensis]